MPLLLNVINCMDTKIFSRLELLFEGGRKHTGVVSTKIYFKNFVLVIFVFFIQDTSYF